VRTPPDVPAEFVLYSINCHIASSAHFYRANHFMYPADISPVAFQERSVQHEAVPACFYHYILYIIIFHTTQSTSIGKKNTTTPTLLYFGYNKLRQIFFRFGNEDPPGHITPDVLLIFIRAIYYLTFSAPNIEHFF
jgi:hypothetical protein